uniref:STI1 domain-containing protein n=1 Tax=Calcidiscus leptoporus TaxID=127549 RepID=A0A7S0J1D4_9EUKA
MADAEKALGNEQFKAGNYPQAIEHFSKAIGISPNHVLYSNRSACHAALGDYDQALRDAEQCIALKADWGKGYGRKGAALHGKGAFDEAVTAYQAGLKVEPGLAMLTNGLEDAKREAAARSQGGGDDGIGGLGNVFSQPDVLAKIAANPQTAAFLADPTFKAKLEELRTNPQSISKHLQDQRVLSVMGMLMGVNIQTPDTFNAGASAAPPPPKKEPVPEPVVELTPEEQERKAKKAKADQHKEQGNTAYKSKNFDEAIQHYEKAIEELPDEMTYYNNMAAVKMEMKDFDGCVETCKKGIEVGRAARADYKLVAKAYARIGNAYKKQGMLSEAIRAYEDSLMEDRTEEVQKLLKQTSAAKRKADEESYMSPEKCEEARQQGNELFKQGKFPEAIAKYEEAMKRDPKAHLPYSNRAACYQKLMEWQLALKDADKCVEMEPGFVKGWSRKASIHVYLKEFHKALDAYNSVLKIEPENEDAKAQIENVLQMVNQSNASGEVDKERQARAMADPEIQAIIGDPQMRSILGEMQSDPKKAQAAMNDPLMAAKLQKLIAAGVLQVR